MQQSETDNKQKYRRMYCDDPSQTNAHHYGAFPSGKIHSCRRETGQLFTDGQVSIGSMCFDFDNFNMLGRLKKIL